MEEHGTTHIAKRIVLSITVVMLRLASTYGIISSCPCQFERFSDCDVRVVGIREKDITIRSSKERREDDGESIHQRAFE